MLAIQQAETHEVSFIMNTHADEVQLVRTKGEMRHFLSRYCNIYSQKSM